MGCPCLSQRRRLCKAGGGGSDDQPLQYRRSMIQGSSHPRTERLAIGQDSCGRLPFPALIFFPPSRGRSRNLRKIFCLGWLLQFVCRTGSGMAGMIPTKGESAAHQLPMPSDGFVTADLVLGPAERMFDVDVGSVPPTYVVHKAGVSLPGWLEGTAARFPHLEKEQAGSSPGTRWRGRVAPWDRWWPRWHVLSCPVHTAQPRFPRPTSPACCRSVSF